MQVVLKYPFTKGFRISHFFMVRKYKRNKTAKPSDKGRLLIPF